MFRSAALLITFFLVSSLCAQEQLLRFRHLMDKDDLSSNSVLSICQDYRGFMWFVTRGGLDRFIPQLNGFRHHRQSDERSSIISNSIEVLLEDAEGKIWIGTEGRGLLLLNKYDYTFRSFTEKDGLPNDVVNAILEDDQSNLWISTNRGISRLSFDESLGDEGIRVSIKNFNSGKGIPGHASKDFWEHYSGKPENRPWCHGI